jgi:hypothetical protein
MAEYDLIADALKKRVAIIASDDFDNWQLIRDYVMTLPANTVLVTRGFSTGDRAAESQAWSQGMVIDDITAHDFMRDILDHPYMENTWFATYARNLVVTVEADTVVIFYNKKIKGYARTIVNHAKKMNTPVLYNPTLPQQTSMF